MAFVLRVYDTDSHLHRVIQFYDGGFQFGYCLRPSLHNYARNYTGNGE
jgi:hypothetical protein